MAKFAVKELIVESGILIFDCPDFDHDSFPALGDALVTLLSAQIVERQQDADLHSWLIDFDGCRLLLKAEHYSQALWLEALEGARSQEELAFIARFIERFSVTPV